MNYALIKNGVVNNTIVCDSDNNATFLFPDFTVVNISDIECGIGWQFDGNNFATPASVKSIDDMAIENITTANAEYIRVTEVINSINEKIVDNDYVDTTEDSVKVALAIWTEYRKSLRAYIRAADGTNKLPLPPLM